MAFKPLSLKSGKGNINREEYTDETLDWSYEGFRRKPSNPVLLSKNQVGMLTIIILGCSNGRWRVETTTGDVVTSYFKSNKTIYLKPGEYFVRCLGIKNFIEPEAFLIDITANQHNRETIFYRPNKNRKGYIEVNMQKNINNEDIFEPSWSLYENPNLGNTLPYTTNLPLEFSEGIYRLDFSSAGENWITPLSRNVHIKPNMISKYSALYINKSTIVETKKGKIKVIINNGSLQLDTIELLDDMLIQPKWYLTTDPQLYESEEEVELFCGKYEISFINIPGWSTPENQIIEILENEITEVIVSYEFNGFDTISLYMTADDQRTNESDYDKRFFKKIINILSYPLKSIYTDQDFSVIIDRSNNIYVSKRLSESVYYHHTDNYTDFELLNSNLDSPIKHICCFQGGLYYALENGLIYMSEYMNYDYSEKYDIHLWSNQFFGKNIKQFVLGESNKMYILLNNGDLYYKIMDSEEFEKEISVNNIEELYSNINNSNMFFMKRKNGLILGTGEFLGSEEVLVGDYYKELPHLQNVQKLVTIPGLVVYQTIDDKFYCFGKTGFYSNNDVDFENFCFLSYLERDTSYMTPQLLPFIFTNKIKNWSIIPDNFCVVLENNEFLECGGSSWDSYPLREISTPFNTNNLIDIFYHFHQRSYYSSHIYYYIAKKVELPEPEEGVYVTNIFLNDNMLNLNKNVSYPLFYTIVPTNAWNQNVEWYSSDPSIVSVDDEGIISTHNISGTATVTVITEDGGYTSRCTINVVYDVSEIKLNINTLDAFINTTVQLYSTILPINAFNQNIMWSTSDDTKAIVNENGLVTILDVVGEVIITVTTEDGNFTDTCVITIIEQDEEIPVTGITLNETNLTLNVLDTYTLTATITPEDATNQDVIWFSINTNIATVNNDGLVTIISKGITQIICTTKDGGYTAICDVIAIQSVTGIQLHTNTLEVFMNTNTLLTYTITPEDASNKKIIWETSDDSIATVNNGVVRSYDVLDEVIITATTDDGNFTDTCVINVIEKTDPIIPVTDIQLNKNSLIMDVSDTFNLIATIIPENATNQNITWFSTNINVATVDDIGLVTAINFGNANIICTTVDGGFTAICSIVVINSINTIPVESVSLNIHEVNILKGTKIQLQTFVRPYNATNKNIIWNSSNNAIATVSNSGLITAIMSGNNNITATTEDGNFTDMCNVTVYELSNIIDPTKYYTQLYMTYNVWNIFCTYNEYISSPSTTLSLYTLDLKKNIFKTALNNQTTIYNFDETITLNNKYINNLIDLYLNIQKYDPEFEFDVTYLNELNNMGSQIELFSLTYLDNTNNNDNVIITLTPIIHIISNIEYTVGYNFQTTITTTNIFNTSFYLNFLVTNLKDGTTKEMKKIVYFYINEKGENN